MHSSQKRPDAGFVEWESDDKCMIDEIEQKWQGGQLSLWKNDIPRIEEFFRRFCVETGELFNKLFELDYSVIQPVIYLVGKIEKMISVCDFLDTLAESNHEDVDKIKIFQLISHSEIIMNNLKLTTENTTKADLVSDFFSPVMDKLKYAFRLTIDDVNKLSKMKQNISASNILYKIRNEYAHQGNFTGRVFIADKKKLNTFNIFAFDWDIPKEKKSISVSGETNLTYLDFMNIYFSAVKNHLEVYSKRIFT